MKTPNHKKTNVMVCCTVPLIWINFYVMEKHEMRMFEGNVIRTAFGINMKEYKIT
jgi:hypothetical protein